MQYTIQQGDEVKYLGLQNVQFWGKAIHDLQQGQEQMDIESLTTPGLIVSINVKDIVSVHSVTTNEGTLSKPLLLESVPLGRLTARWTKDKQLVLTSAQFQHTCSADEVVALLEMLYQHRDAIHDATHQRDQEQPSTPTHEAKPRSQVSSDTDVSSDEVREKRKNISTPVDFDQVTSGDTVEYSNRPNQGTSTGTFQHWHKSDAITWLVVKSHHTDHELAVLKSDVVRITPADTSD